MLFSLEYKKIFLFLSWTSCSILIRFCNERFYGFLLFVQLFLQLDSKDMKGLERLIMQGMYIADRIAAFFFNIAKFINKRLHHNFKSCGGTHHTRSICQLGFVLIFHTVLNDTLNNCANNLPFSRLFDFPYRSASNFPWTGQYRGKIIGYLQIVSLKKNLSF